MQARRAPSLGRGSHANPRPILGFLAGPRHWRPTARPIGIAPLMTADRGSSPARLEPADHRLQPRAPWRARVDRSPRRRRRPTAIATPPPGERHGAATGGERRSRRASDAAAVAGLPADDGRGTQLRPRLGRGDEQGRACRRAPDPPTRSSASARSPRPRSAVPRRPQARPHASRGRDVVDRAARRGAHDRQGRLDGRIVSGPHGVSCQDSASERQVAQEQGQLGDVGDDP